MERVLLRVVGGAITVFAPIMILGLGGGNAAAAMIFGIASLAIVVFELRASAAGPNDASSQYALDPVPCPAHDDNASPAMIEAVTQFAPRLRGLTRLVHGQFAQIDDVGFWQADVILTAYVTGLIAGAAGSDLDRQRRRAAFLLAHFIGAERADAAIARFCSGAAPWTSSLLDVVASIGSLDGARLRDEGIVAAGPQQTARRRASP
ncbi:MULTISPECIES: hypothetical protein [unclassified Bradyrhizobium]|uniref:hypothetical protein n=1 Tax=unclassified Bradyrhizobium TaxID=2631580 RepID=UPI001FFBDBFF|nr:MULTISPECIES: hypothetical protein [unclassified Bradyrhizobium]MCK1708334.1 hypothetical protein [Bradyrhizobium sp. 143]MCK1724186.1 hypothetical protein [Bradyrhizobium sp. 142]